MEANPADTLDNFLRAYDDLMNANSGNFTEAVTGYILGSIAFVIVCFMAFRSETLTNHAMSATATDATAIANKDIDLESGILGYKPELDGTSAAPVELATIRPSAELDGNPVFNDMTTSRPAILCELAGDNLPVAEAPGESEAAGEGP